MCVEGCANAVFTARATAQIERSCMVAEESIRSRASRLSPWMLLEVLAVERSVSEKGAGGDRSRVVEI
jgi:hypothetical protein